MELLVGGIALFSILIVGKLFSISVLDNGFYVALAEDQHEIYRTIMPNRGSVYASDKNGTLYALATQKEYFHIFAVPSEIEDAKDIAEDLFEYIYPKEEILEEENVEKEEDELVQESQEEEPVEQEETEKVLTKEEKEKRDEERLENLIQRLSKSNDPYEPLIERTTEEVYQKIMDFEYAGVYGVPKTFRFFPEEEYTAHVTGFLGQKEDGTKIGQYGIEGFYNDELAGTMGYIHTEKDATGRWITLAEKKFIEAEDGVDLVLTIDKHIQYYACSKLYEAAQHYEIARGSVLVADPNTGAILAMCSYPTFDANEYGQVDGLETYNNMAIFNPYEPGSIFKSITMAIALDQEVVTPQTTYNDEGEIKIGTFTIKNSDQEAHGISTMTEVLEKSLNLGTIFVAHRIGNSEFVKQVKRFGFGEKTGITLDFELAGHLGSLEKEKDIYTATASYGQGITTTPLQMVQAYIALANGGKLMKPYIVSEVRKGNDILQEFNPQVIREVISPKTSTIISGMLVSVLENGHAGQAAVDGYYLAGKTGTAQIASRSGGYEKDKTIHSFVGYGPVDHPKFVMLTRLDEPKGVTYSSQSAAPLFSSIANYILNYYQVPKDY